MKRPEKMSCGEHTAWLGLVKTQEIALKTAKASGFSDEDIDFPRAVVCSKLCLKEEWK